MRAWEEAAEQCDRIMLLCDEVTEQLMASESDSAGDGLEFVESIQNKVESIKSWVRKYRDVTENQQNALNRMEEGVERWRR